MKHKLFFKDAKGCVKRVDYRTKRHGGNINFGGLMHKLQEDEEKLPVQTYTGGKKDKRKKGITSQTKQKARLNDNVLFRKERFWTVSNKSCSSFFSKSSESFVVAFT